MELFLHAHVVLQERGLAAVLLPVQTSAHLTAQPALWEPLSCALLKEKKKKRNGALGEILTLCCGFFY